MKIICLILFSLFFTKDVFAFDAPILISPANNSTTSSSRLTWQKPSYALYPTNFYVVQVDNNSDFSSPEKAPYEEKESYAPQLSPGTWYWRVRAKDSSGTWSDWSSSWSFILGSTGETTSPTPTTSTNTSSPTTPSVSGTTSSFSISDNPSAVKSSDSFAINIQLNLPNNPNTSFYLKGAFYQETSTNYFGKTHVGNDWIKNSSSATSQKQITTDGSGHWSGNIELMPDADDSGYKGSGNYKLKVGRYNSSGSSLTWSNDVNINIENVNVSSPTPVVKSSTITPKPSSSNFSKTPEQTDTSNKSIVSAEEPESTDEYKLPDLSKNTSSDILGESSQSATTIKSKGVNWLFIAAGFIILILGGLTCFKLFREKIRNRWNI